MTTVADRLHRRDAWLRRRFLVGEAIGWVLLLVSSAALVGLLIAYYALVPRFIAEQWERTDHYPGQILETDATGGDSDAGTATVRYGTDSDHQYRATIAVGDVDRWSVGQRVTVLVDPATARATLEGENFTPAWFERTAARIGWPAGVGVVAAAWLVAHCGPRRKAHGRALRPVVGKPHPWPPVVAS